MAPIAATKAKARARNEARRSSGAFGSRVAYVMTLDVHAGGWRFPMGALDGSFVSGASGGNVHLPHVWMGGHMMDVELYRCLSNPTRLGALKALVEAGELCVTDIVAATRGEQTNVSHHLAELRACGLVTARQDGKRVCYKVASPRLRTILELAESFSKHVECADPDACAAAGCCA